MKGQSRSFNRRPFPGYLLCDSRAFPPYSRCDNVAFPIQHLLGDPVENIQRNSNLTHQKSRRSGLLKGSNRFKKFRYFLPQAVNRFDCCGVVFILLKNWIDDTETKNDWTLEATEKLIQLLLYK